MDFAPEISDTRYYHGAYGINDAWLELLKCSTVSTKTTNLYLDKFFEYYIANSSYSSSAKASIHGILKENPKFFELMENLTYAELNNPDFLAKNNANNMVKYINKISKNKLYNTEKEVLPSVFTQAKKDLKAQLEEIRMEK